VAKIRYIFNISRWPLIHIHLLLSAPASSSPAQFQVSSNIKHELSIEHSMPCLFKPNELFVSRQRCCRQALLGPSCAARMYEPFIRWATRKASQKKNTSRFLLLTQASTLGFRPTVASIRKGVRLWCLRSHGMAELGGKCSLRFE
jgi:hypothetical protein